VSALPNGEGRNISDACRRGRIPGWPLRARTRLYATKCNKWLPAGSASLRDRITPTPLTSGCPALLFTGIKFQIEA